MGSPFPGMDPYLEDPHHWPGMHMWLITYMAETLQPQLAPKYVASIGVRAIVDPQDRSILPDIQVVRESALHAYAESAEPAPPEFDEPVVLRAPYSPREGFMEILDPAQGERVITIIELLSPANKMPGTDARRQYCQKQDEVMQSETNLVEIDLQRKGWPTVVATRAPDLPPYHYLISISRAVRRPDCEAYPLTLRQRLPRMIVPLMPEDRDAVVDVQAVYHRGYDNGGYARILDYRREPVVALSEDDAQWARERPRQQGLRD